MASGPSGSPGRIRTDTAHVLSVLTPAVGLRGYGAPLPLPLGYRRMVLPGGLEPPLHRLRAERAALTPRKRGAATRDRTVTCRLPSDRAHLAHRGDLERMAGFEPASSGWKPEALPLDDTRSGSATRIDARPNMDRCRSPAHRQPSVVKDPAHCERVAGWRQRQDSNLDPRALEARMLSVTPRCRRPHASRLFRRHNLPVTWPVLRAGLAKNKKGLPGDHPRRPGSPMNAGL